MKKKKNTGFLTFYIIASGDKYHEEVPMQFTTDEPDEGPSPYSSASLDAAATFTEVRAPKRAKTSVARTMPSSVICALANEAGETAGQQVDLPITSTAKQLQQLLNSLLENEDKVI